MKISVAVAAYNGERFIEKQLLSIKNQNLKVDEVIISDDCSTDNTALICRSFIEKNKLNNWKVIECKENKGYCFNFYNAIENCTGDVIFLADQDDEWYQDKTEKMMSCLENNPEILVLSSRYDLINSNSEIIKDLTVPYMGEVFDGSLQYFDTESFIGCSHIRGFSLCFKSEIKKYLKPLDLKSLLSHDWYIAILGTIFGKTATLNTKLCGYRYHLDNVSLSDMTRKTLLGDRKKRLVGLFESITAHTYIASLTKCENFKNDILKFAEFEKLRLKFLESKNPFLLFKLLFFKRQYSRYYKGNALRVWLGDFAYAYKINFKIRK